jgi:type IV pilus assembly protein PilP
VLVGLSCLLLQGCFDDVSDLKAFMAEVDRNTPRAIAPIIPVKEFAHINYGGIELRDPFAKPKAEAIIDKRAQLLDCLQPDRNRDKEALEKYGLTNLKMKGTMGYNKDPWALIEATSDGSLHRVSVGNYMGLFHGRITQVLHDQVQLVEMVPDGTGCWKERDMTVNMSNANSNQEQN